MLELRSGWYQCGNGMVTFKFAITGNIQAFAGPRRADFACLLFSFFDNCGSTSAGSVLVLARTFTMSAWELIMAIYYT